jgi:hypothetical protein
MFHLYPTWDSYEADSDVAYDENRSVSLNSIFTESLYFDFIENLFIEKGVFGVISSVRVDHNKL